MTATFTRKIVHIDEEKCTGCGLCIPSCHEGALAIIDGKARLVADKLCDGLGNCLGECPHDAIRIETRAADEFDVAAVKTHLESRPEVQPNQHAAPAGFTCPSSRSMKFEPCAAQARTESDTAPSASALGQWPVQLHLVPPDAPYFQDAELLVVADCTSFAYADFHRSLLAGRAVVIGCPKLDDGEAYLAKLTQIFQKSSIRKIVIAYMEVPCCYGLVRLVETALQQSGKTIPVEMIKIGIQGAIK